MIVLGIESSCDETAAAVVEDGRRVRSSVVATQVEIHRRYGGVVPELASRRHLEAIVPVVEQALETAGLGREDIDAVAATQGPGLVGALLVGFSFAKSLAHALEVPLAGVDHLEGHVTSVFLTDDPPAFPFVALLASGGHTSLYHVRDHLSLELLGRTVDDAAGEAFDKVAKMLGLGYPGGALIGHLALNGNPGRIVFPRARLDGRPLDFSFSGLKSAVGRYLETHPGWREEIPDIAAGFQEAVVDALTEKLVRAADLTGCRRVALVGGVAANERLRKKTLASASGMSVHVPPPELCGDNAAMIAAAGWHLLGRDAGLALSADVYSRHRH